jgi:UDP-N-acetylglucosamine 2-epimerase (non-hydrolysing)
MAPLVKEFKKNDTDFNTFVCVTGQHREMLDQVLSLFQIKPDYDLNIMQQDQDLYTMTTAILLGIKDVINKIKPDIVFVHGDTTTSAITALAAFYQKIPVAHVEAGLRSNNKYSPWPEEINRSITDKIATFHFAPTNMSKNNLLRENIDEKYIFVTGNTVIDALYHIKSKFNNNETLIKSIKADIASKGYDLSRLTADRQMVLITGHRRENFGNGFIQICQAIKNLASKYQDIDFVYPVHLNPNVRKPVNEILQNSTTNVFLLDPIDYMHFVYLMDSSYIVLTDSGGIQEEAPGLGKPVLVMRDTTERPEAIKAGTVKLVGIKSAQIEKSVALLINNKKVYDRMASSNNPYGDGTASQQIISSLKKHCYDS